MTRRAGLGRGLDALLPAHEARADSAGSGLNQVPLNAIAPNPRQPRQSFDDDAIGDLAESIRELGILQPLLVRDLGNGRYELVAGERRLRASKLAGLERVPVMTVDTDDRGSLERALVENLHREDLNPIEEAEGYRQLLDEASLTQEELGRRLGRSRVTITNALRLLSLPPAIQKLLVEGRISAAHGRASARSPGQPFPASTCATDWSRGRFGARDRGPRASLSGDDTVEQGSSIAEQASGSRRGSASAQRVPANARQSRCRQAQGPHRVGLRFDGGARTTVADHHRE